MQNCQLDEVLFLHEEEDILKIFRKWGLLEDKSKGREIVKVAVEYSKRGQEDVAVILRKSVEQKIRKLPGGFRTIDKVSSNIFVNRFKNLEFMSPDFAQLILMNWALAQGEKFESVFLHIDKQLECRPSSLENLRTMEMEPFAMTKSFLESYPAFDESIDKIALMIACAIFFGFQEEKTKLVEDWNKKGSSDLLKGSSGELSDLWQICLDRLAECPPDACEWGELPSFIRFFKKLKKEKLKELGFTQAKTELLRLADHFITVHQAYLAYFGIEQISQNQLICTDEASCKKVLQDLSSLDTLLKLYKEKKEQSDKLSLAAARRHREEMQQCEDSILELWGKLASRGVTKEEIKTDESLEPKSSFSDTDNLSIESEMTIVKEQQPVAAAKEESEENLGQTIGVVIDDQTRPSSEDRPEFDEAGTTEANAASEALRNKVETEKAAGEDFTRAGSDSVQDKSESAGSLRAGERARIHDKDIKTYAELNPMHERHEELLYELVFADDLAAAYWLALSAEMSDMKPPIPSWMIAANLGARVLNWDNDHLAANLLSIATTNSPEDSEPQKLLALAAALKPVLIAPLSGMNAWLKEPSSLPQIHNSLTVIKEFMSRQYPLGPEDLGGVEDKERRKDQILRLAESARTFLTDEPKRKLRRRSTARIWKELLEKNAPIHRILSIVGSDQRDKFEQMEKLLIQWGDENKVEDEINRRLSTVLLKPNDIGTSPRRQLLEKIRQATDTGSQWLKFVRRELKSESREGWLSQQIFRLRESMEQDFAKLYDVLCDMASESSAKPMRAGAVLLGRALSQLAEFFNLDVQKEWGERFAGSCCEWLLDESGSLKELLSGRLMWITDLAIGDDQEPKDLQSDAVYAAIASSVQKKVTLLDAGRKWIENQDFRFIEKIKDRLENDHRPDELKLEFKNQLAKARSSLRERAEQARNVVEQAFVDGIISEEEHPKLHEEIGNINPATELDIRSAKMAIKEKIDDVIPSNRRMKMQQLNKLWEEIEPGFQDLMKQGIITEEAKDTVFNFLQSAFERSDVRVLAECLAHLTEVLHAGKRLNMNLFQDSSASHRQSLQDFLGKFEEIEGHLTRFGSAKLLQQIDARQAYTGFNYNSLPGERRESAKNGIAAFIELKKSRTNLKGSVGYVGQLLEFLGYRSFEGSITKITPKYESRDVLYLRASVTAGGLARPIPEYGSLVEGALNVLVLWERPVAETVSSRIKEISVDRQGLIIIYLGPLSLTLRRDALRLSRTNAMTLAILDETLLVFLTQERGERLGAFLRCALPFTELSPYKPFVQGDVPPEMFYGRTEMANALQSYETCIIYGGRQLGKSALLRHVQREFHRPNFDRFAVHLDIKNVGSPASGRAGQYQVEIVEKLRDALKKCGILKTSVKTANLETLKKHIFSFLEEKPERRILVLFDEADNFLNADSVDDFKILQEFSGIMADTMRRFKVVFAGLHTVQRFSRIPNQPLARFGVPLVVGPLDPSSAVKLVREPLEVLGFEVDEATVLRILSYTNYHAGLIQFFCKKIVEYMIKNVKEGNLSPTLKIQREAVEAVYRDQSVRDEIRQRLDLTLELDYRYQAIAWSLIVDQKSEQGTYSLPFTPSKVLNLVREFWPEGFIRSDVDDISSKLDEMCGLGVMIKSVAGDYRLRSPNMVSLMGPYIEARLRELSTRKPEEQFIPDSHHTVLDDNNRHYSPLTFSQERDLTSPEFGVSIIFISEALGLSHLAGAIMRLVPTGYIDTGVAVVKDLSEDVHRSQNQLGVHLKSLIESSSKVEQIIGFVKPRCNSSSLEAMVQEALVFKERHQRSRSKWLKILFILTPEIAENWFRIDPTVREEFENRCDAVISPRLWNEPGIRNRLNHLDKLSSPEVCRAVHDCTGGWPFLIDHLMQPASGENNLNGPSNNLKQRLIEKNSEIRNKFFTAVSIGALTGTAEIVNEFLKEENHAGIPESLVSDLHELIVAEGGLVLTQQQVLDALSYLRRFRLLHFNGEDICMENTVKMLLK